MSGIPEYRARVSWHTINSVMEILHEDTEGFLECYSISTAEFLLANFDASSNDPLKILNDGYSPWLLMLAYRHWERGSKRQWSVPNCPARSSQTAKKAIKTKMEESTQLLVVPATRILLGILVFGRFLEKCSQIFIARSFASSGASSKISWER